MAVDEELARRVREVVAVRPGVSEKRMFGGLAFLVEGRMAVAAGSQGALMVRVDPAESEGLLDPPHVARMVMRGKELAGWLLVDRQALASGEDLRRWVDTGVDHARSLPA